MLESDYYNLQKQGVNVKKLLSIDELIEHMKKKGITFQEVSESDAKVFFTKEQLLYEISRVSV